MLSVQFFMPLFGENIKIAALSSLWSQHSFSVTSAGGVLCFVCSSFAALDVRVAGLPYWYHAT